MEHLMIWLNFERWSAAGGRWFRRDRIYWKKYKWTPFVWVRWRYNAGRRDPDLTCGGG